MENIVAFWKPGMESLYEGIDAEKCANEIMEIGDKTKTREIYERAKDPTSELHKCLEWDDTKAAENYRLVQVRNVTAHLYIQFPKRNENEPDRPPLRLFHKVNEESAYMPITKIIKKEETYQALLQQAYSELRAFKAKYSTLEELREIIDLID